MSTQRTVVITGVGAQRGIGRATAHRFARDGWAVVGLDLDGVAAEALAAELAERYGVPALGRHVDVADEDSVAAARAAVATADLPVVGAVLNIAGITSPVPFLDTTLELWNRIFAVNATGTYLVTKAFLPEMIDAGFGRVINMRLCRPSRAEASSARPLTPPPRPRSSASPDLWLVSWARPASP